MYNDSYDKTHSVVCLLSIDSTKNINSKYPENQYLKVKSLLYKSEVSS